MNTNPPLAAEAFETTKKSPKLVKVSFILPVDEFEGLRARASRRADTFTDTLRWAIALSIFAEEAFRAGSKVLVENPDGTMREIVLR